MANVQRFAMLHRGRRESHWTGRHTFLSATPLDEVADMKPRRVVPIIGFSWGFTDTGTEVQLHDLAVLSDGAWDSHLDSLRASYQWWQFAE
jgi:hypothetical protein